VIFVSKYVQVNHVLILYLCVVFMLSLYVGGLECSRAGWSVVRIPVGVREFYLFQNVPNVFGAHPAVYSVNTGVFPEVKRPGRDVNHSSQYSAEVKNEWSYTSLPPCMPSWHEQGKLYLLLKF
jgi:hypothetical protein